MGEVVAEIIKALPKWLVIGLLLFLVVLLIIAWRSDTQFKIFGLEFGPSPKSKDSDSPKSKDSAVEDYMVTGDVKTSDNKIPNEIMISPRYPPVSPSAEGKIVGLDVWKDPHGRFPVLYFYHQDYLPMAIDLNDTDKAQIVQVGKDMNIQIRHTIVMQRKVTQ